MKKNGIKKFKFILFFALILFAAGCSVSYDALFEGEGGYFAFSLTNETGGTLTNVKVDETSCGTEYPPGSSRYIMEAGADPCVVFYQFRPDKVYIEYSAEKVMGCGVDFTEKEEYETSPGDRSGEIGIALDNKFFSFSLQNTADNIVDMIGFNFTDSASDGVTALSEFSLTTDYLNQKDEVIVSEQSAVTDSKLEYSAVSSFNLFISSKTSEGAMVLDEELVNESDPSNPASETLYRYNQEEETGLLNVRGNHSGLLNNTYIKTGTVKVYLNNVEIGSDEIAEGILEGAGIDSAFDSAVDYKTGQIAFRLSGAPDEAHEITCTYTYYDNTVVADDLSTAVLPHSEIKQGSLQIRLGETLIGWCKPESPGNLIGYDDGKGKGVLSGTFDYSNSELVLVVNDDVVDSVFDGEAEISCSYTYKIADDSGGSLSGAGLTSGSIDPAAGTVSFELTAETVPAYTYEVTCDYHYGIGSSGKKWLGFHRRTDVGVEPDEKKIESVYPLSINAPDTITGVWETFADVDSLMQQNESGSYFFDIVIEPSVP